MSRLPGFRWRTLAWSPGGGDKVEQEFVPTDGVCFDELVIDDWFHLEQMSERHWWMNVGDWHIDVSIPAKGEPRVSMWEDKP
jgi:hypothetical protein